MKRSKHRLFIPGILLPALFALLALWNTGSANAEQAKETAKEQAKETSPQKALQKHPALSTSHLAVAPPPFSDKDIFPCSECHNEEVIEPNSIRRKLTDFHEEIVLQHDEEHRWCLDCHDLENRDKLHLASGELIDFAESYKLCGQCHGSKLRDWKTGIHGKRTGSWSGEKEYLLCVHCHNAHSPKFKPLKPKPPPVRPENLN